MVAVLDDISRVQEFCRAGDDGFVANEIGNVSMSGSEM